MSTTYFLPKGYEPNPAVTVDARSGKTYWNRDRIETSDRFQHAAYGLVARLARRWRARTVVDLGCGVGTKLHRFFGDDFDIVGVDQAPAVLACRERYDRGTWIAEDFEAPTYDLLGARDQIDVLISADVIEHLEDPDRLLEYVHRVVSPATHVVFTTPERDALLGRGARRPVNPAHVREWSFEEFGRYITASGYEPLLHRRLLPFRPLPDKMTVKFAVNRIRHRRSPLTNQILVCRSERPGRPAEPAPATASHP